MDSGWGIWVNAKSGPSGSSDVVNQPWISEAAILAERKTCRLGILIDGGGDASTKVKGRVRAIHDQSPSKVYLR